MEWLTMVADVAVLMVVGAVAWLFRSTALNDRRVAKLEASMEAINVLEEIGSIHRRVDQVADGVAEQRGELKQINRVLGLIHQVLIENGNK